MSKERWADIPGYVGWYQISDKGRVRSVDRKVEQWSRYGHTIIRKLKGQIITPLDNGNGYLVVGLMKNQDRENHYVHRLVAEAFLENPNNLDTVNHLDFNRSNNDYTNLEWTTQLENVRYSLHRMKRQRANRKPPISSGYKYIRIRRPGSYELDIHVGGLKIYKTYKTLQEALDRREEIMSDW